MGVCRGCGAIVLMIAAILSVLTSICVASPSVTKETSLNVPRNLLHSTVKTLGDRLFSNSLPFAKKSLHGSFIEQMIAGTLPQKAFHEYLYQDNLYLSKYSRAFAVLAARAESTDELAWLLNRSLEYLHEHGSGANTALQESEFEKNARPVTVAYTSFFLQAAWGESAILAYASLLPCQRLYDWLFSTIKATRHIADDNPYKEFIYQYADPKNHDVTKTLEQFLERYVEIGIPQQTLERAQYHYDTAMKYEAEFFDQALTMNAVANASYLGSLSENIALVGKARSMVAVHELVEESGKHPIWRRALLCVFGVSMATCLGACLAVSYMRLREGRARRKDTSGSEASCLFVQI